MKYLSMVLILFLIISCGEKNKNNTESPWAIKQPEIKKNNGEQLYFSDLQAEDLNVNDQVLFDSDELGKNIKLKILSTCGDLKENYIGELKERY